MPSWRGAQLRHRDKFTFTLPVEMTIPLSYLKYQARREYLVKFFAELTDVIAMARAQVEGSHL
jgi:hypothetical protein